MRNLFKKLAYLLLTLAIANVSLQAYAAPFHYDKAEMAEQDNSNHCASQKAKQACACENCSCDMCITLQANIQTVPQITLHPLIISDMSSTLITPLYAQGYHHPLLRPPIA